MDNQYEVEINLVTLLFKVCQKWRALLIVAAVAAVAAGGTKLAMNIQGLYDPEKLEERNALYNDTLGIYQAEGEALERSMDENQRNLQLQSDYNDKSMLMKVDPDNEWVGSMNLYIDTGYQVMPGTTLQNENPAHRITYAYNDYYAGEFYVDVMERLSFDMGELKYLKEVLRVSVDAGRYSITIHATADTKEHCDEMIKAAGEAFQSRYDFVRSSLGEHSLTMSDAASNAQVNADRKEYQINQRTRETVLTQNFYSLNEQYREWKKKESTLELPIVDWASAVKNGIKWIIIAAVGGGFLCGAVLFVKYLLSGRIKSSEELGQGVFTLAELPARGKKKNAIDRLIYRLFGVVIKESEYDGRVETMALSLEKMLHARQCEEATVAFVGDVKETEMKALVKQVESMLSVKYKAVAAGDIIAEPAAAKMAYDADAVVLVAEQDVTMKKKYVQIYDKLSACKIEILGAVLLGMESV